ncbi:MAG: hypothetical protein HYT31_00265 [Parcubacteria group bacterium]|nr:hypothetical protein [Parcubacteria group bacterium]
MGFFEAVGMLLGALAGFLGLSFWGAFTKRPTTLFFSLLIIGVLIPMMTGTVGDGNSPWMVIAEVIIFGAIGVGIFGSIMSTGAKARFLMGASMIITSASCFWGFSGMLPSVPLQHPYLHQVMEGLIWVIATPIGLMGLSELICDHPFGVKGARIAH